MNRSASQAVPRAVSEALARAEQDATRSAERVASAKSLKEAEAALAHISSLREAGSLADDRVLERLKTSAEGRVLEFRVQNALAKASAPGDAQPLLDLIEAASPGEPSTEEAALQKRALIRRVILRCGELEIREAVTTTLVSRFNARLEQWYVPTLSPHDPATSGETDATVARLASLALARRASIKRARLGCVALALALLALGPLLTARTVLPVERTDKLHVLNMLDIPLLSYSKQVVYSTRDIRGAVWYTATRHPFLWAAVPLFIAALLRANRVPQSGIAWERVLYKNWSAKLLAITAWAWLFTVTLTHP